MQNIITLKNKEINLAELHVMGVLNITPDSFYDGGKNTDQETIIKKVQTMMDDGATFVDIGGYSSRPGADYVSEEEELNRVIPVINLLVSKFPDIIISIDTFHSNVARQAIQAGASIINDISAGNMDEKMFTTVADLQVPYIMMHMQGTPQTMQDNPSYENICEEELQFFTEKINKLQKLGVKNIIIDPGFGFGKTVEHNYELLNNLQIFQKFGLPVLVGFSRKSMINKVINTTPEQALNGTTVLNTLGLTKDAQILRVHDVKEAKEVITLYKKMISVQ
ncbi:MAG: dihydropteroate synthase [Patescibacteria group bacterium]|nr:dihydropteroate synthase [Patescibacteria group bacterium]